MPGFNHRGPEGQGPMTGRRMGRCTQFGTNERAMNADVKTPAEETTTDANDQLRMGGFFGRGRGFRGGNGFRRGNGHSNRW